MEWLAPVTMFWILIAIYLGGTAIAIRGGGPRQLAGLVVTYALYLVTFALVRMVAGGPGNIRAVVIAVVVASLLLPILSRVGFLVLGVKLSKPAAAH